MRFEGALISWDDARGFGFIAPDQGGDTIFVHIKTIVNRQGRPQIGQRYSFEIELGPQGKKRAKNVLPAQALRPIGSRRDSPAKWGTATLFVIPLFVLVYGVVTVLWRPPSWVALFYVVASVVTFLVYGLDKAAASAQRRRTPEIHLHALSMLGGWPGALLAQQFLRHKSAKAEFRASFWSTVGFNIAAFVLLCSPWAGLLPPRAF
jgi:uncharacterized membrane protein YsdA (DUF1294 family)/cold shock CspA family protein